MPIVTSHQAILKIAFENNTSGTNLGLYVGTVAEFQSGNWWNTVVRFRGARALNS